MTGSECKLWSELRQFRNWYGVHVRRQSPVGPYVADFIVHESRLVIEVDGEHHFTSSGLLRDQVRDEWFGRQGYKIIRFSTGELSDAFSGCVEEILSALGLMKRADFPILEPSSQDGGLLGGSV